MCGFAGAIAPPGRNRESSLRDVAERMGCSLVHRGPDDSGSWIDADAGVVLTHRRLSVIDVSVAGHQPMLSKDSRYVLAYNGEIYNHPQLRAELERDGVRGWRGHSDTEVMLAAFVRWGLRQSLERFNGMFAFALWDRENRSLTLARDRVGEKPLYYGWSGDTFLFGSELKALRSHPAWDSPIDRSALTLYMRHNYVPAPYSIYAGISKLIPGAMLTLPWNGGAIAREPILTSYWSALEVAKEGGGDPLRCSEEEALGELDRLLRDAVQSRMHADVPLGAFLSGGVDSSLVVALMRAQSARPPRTFSIGFEDDRFNEAAHARAVAEHLGTDHVEMIVSGREALNVVPHLPQLYDEPFADSSQIPTFLVARLAREHVTVALSGDGGDELFGGYNRYLWAQRLWRRFGRVPLPLRRAAAGGMLALSPRLWESVGHSVQRVVPRRYRVARVGDNVHRLASILTSRQPSDLYLRLISHWDPPDRIVRDGAEPAEALHRRSEGEGLPSFTQQMMYQDLVGYLPDDILVKVDRATMAVSLEARVPLLDHRVIEFAWRLPERWRTSSGEGKVLLRRLLYRHVPQRLIERPKMGFGVPLDDWLRGPLRDWAETLLAPDKLRNQAFFRPDVVAQSWRDHLAGMRNQSYLLWDVLMFQAWLEAQA